MGYCSINWQVIDVKLPQLIKDGQSQEEIARYFGISPNSVCRRIMRLGLWSDFDDARDQRIRLGKSVGGRKRFNKPKAELVHRYCLRCGRHFVADTRFLRLCSDCREEATVCQGSWS